MSGHVFVVRGDLKRLACDAVVLPCDDAYNIDSVWREFLPVGLPPVSGTSWLRLTSHPDDHAGVALAPSKGRQVRAVVTTVASMVGSQAAPSDVAARLAAGVQHISSGLEPQGGRHLPLIAVPLAGTGSGGLAHRRGEVIAALLPALRRAAYGVDVALVLWHRSDVAAVQEARVGDADWTELTSELIQEADRLGTLAGHDRLSLFVGAGVSKPVGFPDWWGLLAELATKAELTIDPTEKDPLRAATPIVAAFGPAYHETMAGLLGGENPQHAIGHALLAGLQVRQMVTTNFDCCLERALDSSLEGEGRYRVLTRKLADSSVPWLLKLHGDLAQPGSLVLTEQDYEKQRQDYQALYGVVQGLMLTSHLLFVGFGLTDQNFLELAASVTTVRKSAMVDDGPGDTKAGTALALTRSIADTHQGFAGDLHLLPITDDSEVEAAARLLEIFLDRLAWRAAREHGLSAEYLLDDNYASGLNAADRELRSALTSMLKTLPAEARTSAGWRRVEETLQSLGYGHGRSV